MRTTIIVTLEIEGIHRWPDAEKELPSVAFLSNPHRHMFHIKAEKVVEHNDREVEIIMFKRHMESTIRTKYRDTTVGDGWRQVCQFGSRSCETLAKEFIEEFTLVSCEVLEDGENGAKVVVIGR